ncbi:MAG TPA: 30S ribosomal protein S12 methylthiotransferase RimO [Candidatus Gastranaerophilales bacterium]|nr:30S ribosomal protein S12 methylthiotransferase RimO [Candidatus Gastranaerophilales bacterium]
MKVSLISLGCPKNLVDSENMLGILQQEGFEITLSEDNADFVIVNTCSFIKEAEKESVKTILALAESGKKVVITGCLAQKYKQELQEAIPEAFAIIGTGDYQKIGEIMKSLSNNDKKRFEISETPEYRHIESIKRFHISTGSGAYIKIAEGCNYSCAFCVIPYLRGKYISRTMDSIAKEAKELGKEGLSEIILIAQDTASYGKDIYGKPSLGKLLEKLNDIEEISWIRPMYFYPSPVFLDDELLNTMARLEKVVKYIDIPLQHSHPEILKLMQRPVVDNGKLIEKIREKMPDAAIRTVFITGFPGETEKHFEHLYKFVEKYRFDKLGVFEYSREKTTASDKFKKHVSSKIKKFRKKQIMELQQGISREINTGLIGKQIPCIVETINSGKQIVGRTYRDAPEVDGVIYIETTQDVNPGDIVPVTITNASEYDLHGVIA